MNGEPPMDNGPNSLLELRELELAQAEGEIKRLTAVLNIAAESWAKTYYADNPARIPEGIGEKKAEWFAQAEALKGENNATKEETDKDTTDGRSL